MNMSSQLIGTHLWPVCVQFACVRPLCRPICRPVCMYEHEKLPTGFPHLANQQIPNHFPTFQILTPIISQFFISSLPTFLILIPNYFPTFQILIPNYFPTKATWFIWLFRSKIYIPNFSTFFKMFELFCFSFFCGLPTKLHKFNKFPTYSSFKSGFPPNIWKKVPTFAWPLAWHEHKFPWPFLAFDKKFYLEYEMIIITFFFNENHYIFFYFEIVNTF